MQEGEVASSNLAGCASESLVTVMVQRAAPTGPMRTLTKAEKTELERWLYPQLGELTAD